MRRLLLPFFVVISHLCLGQYVVTNTNQNGAGSFAQAVVDANSDGVPSIITFNIPNSDPNYVLVDGNDTWTIFHNGVANVNGGLVVDGSSQPGTGDIKIIFDGGRSRDWIEYQNSGGEDFEINNIKFVDHWANIGGSVIRYRNGGQLVITDCMFELNRSGNNGGAIRIYDNAATVFISSSIFDANTAQNGGGAIIAETSGLLSLTDCTFEDNVAMSTNGGAILNTGSHSYSITSSAFIRNSALLGFGGAFNVNSSSHSMDNSTVSSNQALDGAAIYFNDPFMGFTIISSTFFDNRATNVGGGLFVQDGSVSLEHTVVAGNTPDDLNVGVGSINSDDYNLIGYDPSAIMTPLTNDQVGVSAPIDPELGPLGFNGGFTPNHSPLSGSPLVDAGNQTDLFTSNDQRGFPRVDGTEADIGAVELEVSEAPHIYWTENLGSLPSGDDEIHRTDLEGNSFFPYYSGFSGEIAGIEIDTINNRIYWTDAANARIRYGVIGGSGFSAGPFTVIDFAPSSTNDLEDLALDVSNNRIYFSHGNAETGFTNKIARVDTDGSNYQELIDLGFEEPFGIDLDLANGKIYFTTNILGTGLDARLYRMNLNGTGLEELMYENTSFPYKYFRDVKIDAINEQVYMSAGREDLPGGEIFYNDINEASPFTSPSVFSFAGEPRGIDLDLYNNKLYWVCRGANDGATPPMIMRSELDGSNIENIFTVTMFPSGFPPGPPGSAHIALDVRGAQITKVNLVSTNPQNNQSIPANGNILFEFDRPMSVASAMANIVIRGEQTGILSGTFSGDVSTTITFDPDNNFKAGEIIRISILPTLQATAGETITSHHHLELQTQTATSPESPAFFREGVLIPGSTLGSFDAVIAVDMEGDGDIDAASGQDGATEEVAWHENDGLQNFGIATVEAGNFEPEVVVAGDIDSDGDIDLLRTSNGAMYWHENDGSENFVTNFINQLGVGAGNPSAVLRDVDSDGDMDIVSCWLYVPNMFSRVWWAENDGSENFTRRELPISIQYPWEVESLDINSDGFVDIIAFNSGEIAWYLNDGNQNFSEFKLQTGLTAQYSGGEVADFNGDGAMDFLISTTIETVWYENDGSFNFTPLPLGAGNDQIEVADADGDGDIDFFGGDFGSFRFYENDGTGSFTIRTSSASNNSFEGMYPVDLDRDGDQDVIVGGNTSGSRFVWFENTTILPSAPEIEVFEGNDNSGTPILNGQSTAILFGTELVGTDTDITFAIENTGSAVLSIGSIVVSGSAYNVIGAPSTVGIGATETFTIQLSGASVGSFIETVTITNNDSDESSFTFPIVGSIVASFDPEINVYQGLSNNGPSITNGQTAAIDFGTGQVGTDITASFAIENTGVNPLLISDISVSGNAFSVGTIPTSITAGSTESFNIILSGAVEGSFNETVTITHNDADLSPFSFPLTGTISILSLPEINVFVGMDNTGPEVLDDQTTAIDLGSANTGTNIDQVFTIENTGTADLNIIGISISGDTEVTLTGTIPTLVAAGATENFTLQVDGTVAGTYSVDVTIDNNDSNESSFDFPVSGTIQDPPVPNLEVFTNRNNPVQLSQNSSIDLGNGPVGAALDTIISVTNSGTTDLSIQSITSSANEFSITGNQGAIVPGQSNDFTIVLEGSNPGTFSSLVTIVSNDPDEPSFVLNFAGVIEEAQIVLINSTDTTQLENGQSNPVTGSTSEFEPLTISIVISNPGNVVLNIQSITINNSVFSLSNIPVSVAPGEAETFLIIVDENVPGVHNAQVTIESDLGTFIFPVEVAVIELPPGLVVYNAVSPNGDGKHDFLKIQGIEAYPSSSVTIFSRLGSIVYKVDGYNNSTSALRFEGDGNVGSFGELPSGTYYYIIELGTDDPNVKGFLVLNR